LLGSLEQWGEEKNGEVEEENCEKRGVAGFQSPPKHSSGLLRRRGSESFGRRKLSSNI